MEHFNIIIFHKFTSLDVLTSNKQSIKREIPGKILKYSTLCTVDTIPSGPEIHTHDRIRVSKSTELSGQVPIVYKICILQFNGATIFNTPLAPHTSKILANTTYIRKKA